MSAFELLKEKLENHIIYASNPRTGFRLEAVEAIEERTDFSSNTLYISSEERAIAALQKRKGELQDLPVLLLISAEVSKNFLLQKLCEKFEISVLMCSLPVSELYLTAAQTFQYYLGMSEKVERFAKIRNITSLLSNISDYVQENLLLTNANGNILYEIGDVKESTRELVRSSFTEVLFRDAPDNFETADGREYFSHNGVNYVKLVKANSIIGILFLEQTANRAQDLERFFQKLSPFIAEFLVNDMNSKKSIQAKFDYIWNDIMEGRYSSSRDIKNIFDHSGLRTSEFFRLIVIQVHELANKVHQVYAELVPHIQELLPNSHVTLYLGSIVVLNWEEDRGYVVPENIRKLEPLLRQYNCHACYSWTTRKLSWLSLLFDYSIQELRLEQQLKKTSDNVLMAFGELSPYLMIDMCAQYARNMKHTRNIMLMTHPAVINLYRYDQEHHTNLEEVLHHYLINHRSLEMTAQSLYMHRNTVVNKLRKIRQLTPIDLDAPEVQGHLIMSHYLLEYCIKVIDNNYLSRDQSDVF